MENLTESTTTKKYLVERKKDYSKVVEHTINMKKKNLITFPYASNKKVELKIKKLLPLNNKATNNPSKQ